MLKLRGDGALRAQAARGDVAAFTAVYERHHQALYRYCRSILQHEEDARDALQNTMTKAFAALRHEQRDFELRPWLFRIAHNEAISLVRQRRPTCELEADILAGPRLVTDDAADRERLCHLRADLNDLPDHQRIALVLRELNGLGHNEIAAVLECSSAAVKQAIFEARTGLHEFEQGRAMACDEVQRKLSDSDGRVLRGRRLRAHLRSCRSCQQFSTSLAQRPAALAMLAPPLPLAAGTTLLHHLLPGAKAAAAGGGATATGVGGGVAATVATKSILVLAAATAVIGGVKAAPALTPDHAGGSSTPASASAAHGKAKSRPTAVHVGSRPHARTKRAGRHLGTTGGALSAPAPARSAPRPTPSGPSSPATAPAASASPAPPQQHHVSHVPAGSGNPASPTHGRPSTPGRSSTPAPAAAEHGKSEDHQPGGTPVGGPPQGLTPGVPPVATDNHRNSTPPSVIPGHGQDAASGHAHVPAAQ
jgi:RNA polymerase sigma factor (sigma-70 family)